MPSHLQDFHCIWIFATCKTGLLVNVWTENVSMNKSLDINSSAVQRFELSLESQPQLNQMYFAVEPWCRVAVHWMVQFK